MANEIITTSGNELTDGSIWTGAIVAAVRGNYEITAPNTNRKCVLRREQDFQKLNKTKKPILLKPALYKIMQAYGVFALTDIRPVVENADEKNPIFCYAATTEIFYLTPDGQKVVVANGHGAASTGEKRNGFASPYDTMNTAIKFAEKRSLSDAVINLTGLSNIFYQDMENEDFMEGSNTLTGTLDDNSPVTPKQIKRIYALANEAGLNAKQAKDKLAVAGYTSTKDIKQKEYDAVCALFAKEATE